MYLISSAKLRKTAAALEETRAYHEALRTELLKIFEKMPDIRHKFLGNMKDSSPEGTKGLLVITADKGLCGSYNNDIVKFTLREMEKSENTRLFVVGEFGRRFFERRGYTPEPDFDFTDKDPILGRARRIAARMIEEFMDDGISRIEVIYTLSGKHSLTGQVTAETVLPVRLKEDIIRDMKEEEKLEFYPDARSILDKAVPAYVTGCIYSALLESFYCEQNARMTAMDSADKNAGELLEKLNLQYSHLRQNKITNELIEISASAKKQKGETHKWQQAE